MNTLGLLALLATAPDGGSSPASTSTFVYTVMFCDASTCGDDVLQRRGVEKLNPNLGTTPFAVESGTEPELVTEKTPIHVKVNQARLIRFPCAPNRIAFNDYPWAFTPTNTRAKVSCGVCTLAARP